MAILLGVILFLSISISFSLPQIGFFLQKEMLKSKDLSTLSLKKLKALTSEGRVVLYKVENVRTLMSKKDIVFIDLPYRMKPLTDFLRYSSLGVYLTNGQSFRFYSDEGQRVYIFPYNGSYTLSGSCSQRGEHFLCSGGSNDVYFSSSGGEGRLVIVSDNRRIDSVTGAEYYRLGTDSFLSQLDGRGVVVAVVDTGINWCHPAFLDERGGTRILFYYETDTGRELSSQDIEREIRKGNCGNDTIGHGSPVTGIVAGDELPYKGIAPASHIIVVKVDADGLIDDADVIQALDYLRKKRAVLNRPFVVNVSLGMYVGPRDGTGLVARKVDEVSGEGFIVVVAGGNSGSEPVHAQVRNISSPTTVRLFSKEGDIIEGWYSRGLELKVELCSSVCVSALPGELKSDFLNSCPVIVDNTMTSSPLNGDGVFYVSFECPGEFELRLEPLSGNGKVDLYLTNGSYFPGISGFENFVDRDTYGGVYGTVASPGTSKRAITVGAFISKPSSTDFSGESFLNLGKITSFSSRGPTRDGRIKPEVSAGGMWVWSASPDGEGYIPNAGTSFSAPVVSGLVALYLQANPNATPEEVREWLISNAIMDDPNLSKTPNNLYGYGKAVWREPDSAALSAGSSGGCSTTGSALYSLIVLLFISLKLLIAGCSKANSEPGKQEKLSPRLRAYMKKTGTLPAKVLVLTEEGKVKVVEPDEKKFRELLKSRRVRYIDIPSEVKPLR